MASSGLEVAHIFRRFGPAYRQEHALPRHHLRAMRAIERCRTAALGGHLYECDQCGAPQIFYNSCRNRHCPKCQNLDTQRWLVKRREELLPVPYFHLVFTLPAELNDLIWRNQRVLYDLLFTSASETLLELAADPQHLWARIGFLAVLHTWSQQMTGHPHLHCIVPGGGLSVDRRRWIGSRPDFFLPVRVLSALFRGKFLHRLRALHAAGKLQFPGKVSDLESPRAFRELLGPLFAKDWIVYCKPPFGGPRQVLEYLSRYTHRVAISNERLVRMDDEQVIFRYRDRSHGDRLREMTLSGEEFVRRFLLHVLPDRFVRIRSYGLLATRNRSRDLALCRQLLGVGSPEEPAPQEEGESWSELLERLTGLDPMLCPECRQGRLQWRRELAAESQPTRAPP